MPLLSKPAFGPRVSIIYITLGALLDVWTGVWYMTFARDDHGNISRNTWFWLAGFFLTGITLIVIGVLIGEIGRKARKAELPPPEAQPQEANIQQTAAAVPQAVVTSAVPATTAGAPVAANPMMGAMPAAAAQMPAAQPAPASHQFVPGVTKR
jgi:hypothetical protein